MITISCVIIPWVITIIFLLLMFRPTRDSGGYLGDSFEMMGRLFYTIPISITWAIYFAIRYYILIN